MSKIIFDKKTRNKIEHSWNIMLKDAGIKVISNYRDDIVIKMSKKLVLDKGIGNNQTFMKALYALIINSYYDNIINHIYIIYSYNKSDIKYTVVGMPVSPSINIYLEKDMDIERMEKVLICSFNNLLYPTPENNKIYVDTIMKNIDNRIKPHNINNNEFKKWKNIIRKIYKNVKDEDAMTNYIIKVLSCKKDKDIENAKYIISSSENSLKFRNIIYSTLSYALMYSTYNQQDLKIRNNILSNRIINEFNYYNFT